MSGRIEELLQLVVKTNRTECLTFIENNRRLFDSSKGSATKHQPWPGGYRDHITEVMEIAIATYVALARIRPLPFSQSDALFGCFLHDIEKIWKHVLDPQDKQVIDKNTVLLGNFTLNADHWNAIKYAHGEGDDYHPTDRIQCPLAAFVHHCDNTSARIWFDKPDPRDRSLSPQQEYEQLVADYCPDKIDERVAKRMLELEQIVFTDQDRQSLVPDKFHRSVRREEALLLMERFHLNPDDVQAMDDDLRRRMIAFARARPIGG